MRWTRPVVILGALVASVVLTAAGVVAYRTGELSGCGEPGEAHRSR